ncbi:MAG: PAS domain S-box protein, partial [Mariprofundaceae bacterium]
MKKKATSSYRFIGSSKGTIFAFSCMILFMLLLGIYAHLQLQQAHRVTKDLYKHPFVVSNAVREINTHIISMHRSMKDVASAENDTDMQNAIDQVNAHEQQALIHFDKTLDRFLGDKTKIKTIRTFFINWKPIRDEVIELSKKGHQHEAQAITKGKGAEYVKQLEVMVASLIHFATNKADELYQDSESRMAESALIATTLMLIVVLLSLMIAISVVRFQREAQEKTKLHLEELEKSELKYRELLESSPDAVLIVDKNRCIQIVNSQASIMFGYATEELIGETIERLIPSRYAHQHQAMADGFVDTPKINPKSQRRLTALKKDGSEFPVSVSLSPVTIGGELFITSDVRDMTEQEEIERNLRQAQKMESIGTLVGGIAHDFNNMLAAITGSVYLAKRDLKAKDNAHLNTVETQCKHAAGIVSQLLAFARRDIVQVEPL